MMYDLMHGGLLSGRPSIWMMNLFAKPATARGRPPQEIALGMILYDNLKDRAQTLRLQDLGVAFQYENGVE
jgi:hypothetical protein